MGATNSRRLYSGEDSSSPSPGRHIELVAERDKIANNLKRMQNEKSESALNRRRSRTFSGEDNGPQEHKSIYSVFRWNKGGKNVYVSGSWDNWRTKIPLVASHGNFTTILQIPEGTHQYKFFVDNKWVHDDEQPTVDNDLGTKNNVLEINKTDFEVFDALAVDIASLRHTKDKSSDKQANNNLANLDSPTTGKMLGNQQDSKAASLEEKHPPDYFTLWDYGQKIPPKPPKSSETSKSQSTNSAITDPPGLPPQLLQVLLNRDVPYNYEPALLPEPSSRAILNHLYALSIKDGVMVLSCTHRHKKKYVTTLFYKQVK